MIQRLLRCTALSLAIATRAHAQVDLIPPGAHVRVTLAANLSRVEGDLLVNRPDTLAIATSPGVVRRIATNAITRFEVRDKSRRAGALKGALIGAPIGCLVVCGQGSELGGPAEMAGAVAMWSALGAGIGVFVRANAWRAVPLTHRAVVVVESPAATVLSTDNSIGPPPGTRVRLHLIPPPAKVTGLVLSGTADSLFISTPHAEPLRLSRQAVTSIDVSQGIDRGAGAWRGILTTVGIGAVIGAVVCVDQEHCGTEFGAHPGPGGRLIWGTLLGTVSGALLSPIGGVIGWNVGVERWSPWVR